MNNYNFYKYSTYMLAIALAVVVSSIVFFEQGLGIETRFDDPDRTAETQPGDTWYIPESFLTAHSVYQGIDSGVRFADVNGDGLPDLMYGPPGGGSRLYLNTGSGWEDTGKGGPFGFYNSDHRMADINGDGLIDVLSAQKEGESFVQNVHMNNGSNGWVQDYSWKLPVPFVLNGKDNGVQLVDVNGDGLVDVLWSNDERWGDTPSPHNEVYLNNGTGWVAVP